MAGSTLDQFTTFWQSTGARYLTGLENVINMATKTTYTMPNLLSGSSFEDMVQSGEVIKDRVFFNPTATFQRINPDEELTYQNPQSGVDWTVPWAIAVAHTGWNKWEFSLNSDQMRPEALAHVFKKVRKQKFQNLYTDVCNSLDDELWAVPVAAMESTTSTLVPRSIPYIINEFINAQHGDGVSAVISANLQNISSTTYADWQPVRVGYGYESTDAASSAGTKGIFASLTNAFLRTNFAALPAHPEHSEKASSPDVIMTQTQGVINFEHAVRVNQDEFRGVGKTSGEDPAYMGPTFRNVAIKHIAALDTAAIYPTGENEAEMLDATLAVYSDLTQDSANYSIAGGSVGVTATAVANSGPRYYGINGRYLRPVFHGSDFMSFEPIITPEKQPFNRVQVASITNNLVCRSRRNHFLVHPVGKLNTGDVNPMDNA